MARWELGVLAAMFVVGVVVFLLVLWRKPIRPQATATQHPERHPYRGVSVRFRATACEAAKQLAGKRFLARQAPPLPLPECNSAHCTCRYVYHDDRRDGEDRRSGLPSPFALINPDRRLGTGRRSSDKVA
jgi:hypothetical protein